MNQRKLPIVLSNSDDDDTAYDITSLPSSIVDPPRDSLPAVMTMILMRMRTRAIILFSGILQIPITTTKILTLRERSLY